MKIERKKSAFRMKTFNTAGVCIPSKHYMVNLSAKIKEIEKLVNDGKYFVIHRARQYGKTTTIAALETALAFSYDVVSIDFQDATEALFESENRFVKGLSQILCDARDSMGIPVPTSHYENLLVLAKEDRSVFLNDLFRIFDYWCRTNPRPVVLIIDEVDSAANNQVFLDFLGKLRASYLKREKNDKYRTFHSVILASVTDITHLRGKIREEDRHRVNSPWNIAADFDIDMSLSEEGIKDMLDDYEMDHHTGMDTKLVAGAVRDYSNGYPYFVSRICQLIDTKISAKFKKPSDAWSLYGVDEAVKLILSEDNTFFDSVMGKLGNYPELRGQLRRILFRGETLPFLPDDEEQKQLRMYGFIRNENNIVALTNKIIEMRLYNYFIGESEKNNELRQSAAGDRSLFVFDGLLDVRKIMEHFIIEHKRIHGEQSEKFLEEEGRERFLTYLSPIIIGTGTYSIEEQTRNHRRMDVVIHYKGKRYIIELKIWHGERYNVEGEKQIKEYLDYWDLDTGYMLSFNFNKKKESGVRRIRIEDKTLFEGIV